MTPTTVGTENDGPPPGARWVQALAIVAIVAVVAIDAWGPSEFMSSRELYAVLGAAALGLSARDLIALIDAWRKR